MTEFWALLGQIFVIVIAQTLVARFIDKDEKGILNLVNVLCYAASLFLVTQFVFDNYMPDLKDMFTAAFE